MTKIIKSKKIPLRIAIIAHVFYSKIWPEIHECITNLMSVDGIQVSIFVSYTEGDQELEREIKQTLPFAKLFPVKNVGWDVWPFLRILNELDIDDWDVVVKFHTKRDVDAMWMNFLPFLHSSGWRRALLSFASSSRLARRTIKAFRTQQKLGMIAGERVIDPGGFGMGRELRGSENMLYEMNLPINKVPSVVWGTMWAARAQLLSPIWRRWKESDFVAPSANNLHENYGLAGECEILFGALICSQGYFISSGRFPQSIARVYYFMKMHIFHFLRFILGGIKVAKID